MADQCETAAVRYSLSINPNKKKEYTMVKATAETIDFNEMRELIVGNFPDDTPHPVAEKLEFGYVKPGHGLKGKKEWIIDSKDMQEFIGKYGDKLKKKEITFWCYSKRPHDCNEAKRGKKRSRSKSPNKSKPGSSRYDSHVAKMRKVDEIYDKLHAAHGNKYSAEQKRAWAHLVELGNHDSLDAPPKKPFFHNHSISNSNSPSRPSAASKSAVTPTSSSPGQAGRRVSIRSECIDQLKKWHALLDCGAINQQQYEELQGTILSDIKKL